MAVERPTHERVEVDVDTLGGAAAGLRSLHGLSDWRGDENIGLTFGDGVTFGPASGVGNAHDKAMRVASAVVSRIEKLNTLYADDAAAAAADTYGTSARHSAAAVNAAAKGITDPSRVDRGRASAIRAGPYGPDPGSTVAPRPSRRRRRS